MVTKSNKDKTSISGELTGDYDNIVGKSLNKYLDAPNKPTSIELTQPILDAFNDNPELKRRLSSTCRRLLAQYLITNGFGTQRLEDEIKAIDDLERKLKMYKQDLNEIRLKKINEIVEQSRFEAEQVTLRDKLVEFLSTEAIKFKDRERSYLIGELPESTKKFLMDLIEKSLKPEIEDKFSIKMTTEEIYIKLGLGKQK